MIKKILISFLVIISIIGFAYVLKDDVVNESIADNDRFILLEKQTLCGWNDLTCFYDKETRVMYLSTQVYKGGGLTVMLDSEGKPLLWEE